MPEPVADPATPATHDAFPPPDLRRDGPAVAAMGALFLLSIGLAMAFSSTFLAQNVKAFDDPDNVWNSVFYLVIVIAFTVAILLLARWKRITIKYIVLASVFITIGYVLGPLLDAAMGNPQFLGLGIGTEIALVVGAVLTGLLWFYPEWYVIDAVGLLVAGGAAAIFGISLSILPTLLLLVAFAVYDAIAVYRTKHMLSLADSVLELRLPIMFVVPKTRHYSFLQETRKVRDPGPEDTPERREAMFMGLGDAVIPGVLVVSAMTYLDRFAPGLQVAGLGAPLVVALVTLLGSFVGFGVLMWFVMKGQPHAGLPLLNGGAIVGFLAALLPIYGLAPLLRFG